VLPFVWWTRFLYDSWGLERGYDLIDFTDCQKYVLPAVKECAQVNDHAIFLFDILEYQIVKGTGHEVGVSSIGFIEFSSKPSYRESVNAAMPSS